MSLPGPSVDKDGSTMAGGLPDSLVMDSPLAFDLPEWGARARWMLSLEAIIDLASVVPWYVALGVAAGQNQSEAAQAASGAGDSVPSLAFLRALRLFRILKTDRWTTAFESVARVLWTNREILLVGLFACTVLLVFTATLLYYAEQLSSGGGRGPADSRLDSIPNTLYVAVMMLTGQGGPDG